MNAPIPSTGPVTRMLCVLCRDITGVPSDVSLSACPGCGSTGVPADADDTVTLTLTVHELRILTIWASNWELQGDRSTPVTLAIVNALLEQWPDGKSVPPLTLAGEIAELRAAFPESQVKVTEVPRRLDLP